MSLILQQHTAFLLLAILFSATVQAVPAEGHALVLEVEATRDVAEARGSLGRGWGLESECSQCGEQCEDAKRL